MELHGRNIIGGKISAAGRKTFHGIGAATGEELDPAYCEATVEEIRQALEAAASAFVEIRRLPAERIAGFLNRIADEIVGLGDDLIRRASVETALPEPRLIAERARTVGQLKMFAEVVLSGDWLEATIDRAIPDRKPFPKPDIRRMLVPLGPVVVFGASNFPLAFSVAGGDTASALAAGNPVVVKAHPAHPGTSEIVARAIQCAAQACDMPAGIFSLLHGASNDVGLQLVRHPQTRAVGFTGSLRAGRALFDAAAARPEPIPVFAEMGSINPVFVLPGALEQHTDALAEGLIQSVTLGVGQFCTNPGVILGLQSARLDAFVAKAGQLASNVPPGTMLHRGICDRYRVVVDEFQGIPNVRLAGGAAGADKARAPALVFATDGGTFRKHAALREENFGPSTIVVSCRTSEEVEGIALSMAGQLTATIFGTDEDLARNSRLISILREKAGRLIYNQFPTGVEVCAAMQHGGPYPAATDSRSTSVGAAAIKRFARPAAFQNFPDTALPVELQNQNLRKIRRFVDNHFTADDL